MRRPLNKQIIVVYPDGAYSLMFRKYVSVWDFREACTKKNCQYPEEHCVFDGQFFYKPRVKEVA